jgi:thiol-disulfide isomerase/thioredoxin
MSLKNSLFALMLLALLPATSWASEESFTQAKFEALQREGAIVLIEFAASWCPTCARQAAIIEQYRAEKPDVPLHVLRVDFDKQKEWVKHFKAPRQSTLVL